MDDHALLLAAVTASVVYVVKRVYAWKTGTALAKELTFGIGAGVGFALYLLDWWLPWLFQEGVVQAFSMGLSVPGMIGVLSDLAKKAGVERTVTVTQPPEEVEVLPEPYEIGENAEAGDGLPTVSTKELIEEIPPEGDDLPTYKIRRPDEPAPEGTVDR